MTIFVTKRIMDAYGLVQGEGRCSCGCFIGVVHCPECGSTQCYGSKRSAPMVILPGQNQSEKVRAFRCKLCTLLYDETECVKACRAQRGWLQKAEQKQRKTKVTPAVANEIIEGLKRLNPQKYGGMKTLDKNGLPIKDPQDGEQNKNRLEKADLTDPREQL